MVSVVVLFMVLFMVLLMVLFMVLLMVLFMYLVLKRIDCRKYFYESYPPDHVHSSKLIEVL